MNKIKTSLHMPPFSLAPYTGQGIGIAFLDTGIFPHQDFIFPHNRIGAFYDFTSNKRLAYDDNGHGTHICGIAAGNGSASRNHICGMAPGSHLIVGKVLDSGGNGTIKAVQMGIAWILSNIKNLNIRILNISIGTEDSGSDQEHSVLVQCVESAWDSGLVVVVAAGNNGPKPMSVTTPGISRKVITVGASDDNQCIDVGGKKIISYSGRGPTRTCVIKPDLIVPGSNIMSCSNKKSPGQFLYARRSGTSMATPVVSGAIALLLEKSPDLSNTQVKLKLRECCDDLGYSKYRQGWGQLNLTRLLL